MKYKVEGRRVQMMERWVRATDEAAALAKVRDEVSTPWGGFATWSTVNTTAEVVEAQGDGLGPIDAVTGLPLLMSVANAAKHLGIGRASLYELVSAGEIEHVRVGSRIFISQEQMNDFIRTHSRVGERECDA
jgi:excisionase family DNA binding protein